MRSKKSAQERGCVRKKESSRVWGGAVFTEGGREEDQVDAMGLLVVLDREVRGRERLLIEERDGGLSFLGPVVPRLVVV